MWEKKILIHSFPKICRIAYNYSFLCCLPFYFKAIISIGMIATVYESLTLAGFLQHCVDRSFVKRKKKRKKKITQANIQGSITILSVSGG